MAGANQNLSSKYSMCIRRFKKGINVSCVKDYDFLTEHDSVVICEKDEAGSSQDGVISLSRLIPGAISNLHKHTSSSSRTGKETDLVVLGQDGSVGRVALQFQERTHDDRSSTRPSNRDVKTQMHWTYSAKQLQQVIGASQSRSLTSIHFLGVDDKDVFLLLGKHLCRLQDSTENESWALSWEHSTIRAEDIVHARQTKGFLFTLHPSGNISIFSMSRCRLVAHINHKDFIHSLFANASILESQDTGRPCRLDVSHDLQNIVVAYTHAKYGLYRINLPEYFSHNPRHVFHPVRPRLDVDPRRGKPKLDRDEDEFDFTRGSPVSEKGAPGNRTWGSYLDTLKNKLGGDGARADKGSQKAASGDATAAWQKWFLIADGQAPPVDHRMMPPGTRDGKPKVQITGFQRKATGMTRSGRMGSGEERVRGGDPGAETRVSSAVRTAKAYRGLPVKGIFSNSSSALVWYGESMQGQGGERHGGLCFLDFKDNAVQFHSFQEPTLVSLSEDPTQPHTLLTRSEVRLLSIDMDQEMVVNKMMVYKSATVTEALCHLNNWDHCSIPIHALEVGLKHRQLDTIAFFLKSRENMFRLKQTKQESSAPAVSSPSSSSSNDALQLWKAMDLLSEAIATNISDKQSKQYANQLLNLGLNHLNKLIHNATTTLGESSASPATSAVTMTSTSSSGINTATMPPAAPNATRMATTAETSELGGLVVLVVAEGFEGTWTDLQDALKKLIAYTVRLRRHLKGAPRWIFADGDESDGGSESVTDSFYGGSRKATLSVMHAWESKAPQEIIKSAILRREIPLAQAYLRCRQAKRQAQQAERTGPMEAQIIEGLPLVIDAGQVLVYRALLNGDLETANTMLQNMGFNVSEEVKKICLYTANTGLRDFLIAELTQTQDLTSEEQEMVKFVHQLEHLYTCQSFEKAKALAIERKKRHTPSSSKPSSAWLPPVDTDSQKYLEGVVQRGDIFVSGEPANCENFNYGHVVLEWVRHWNEETRDRVLLEQLLASRVKDSSLDYTLDADSAWSYLTSHHRWDQLKLWIRSSLVLDLDQPSGQAQESESLSPWLRQLALSPSVVHKMDSCSADLREKILDELSRHGIFSSAELASFDLITRRLSSTGRLFQHPHPLGQRSETAAITSSFKQWYLDMCVKKRLPGLLYAFLDFYSLCLSENEVMSLQLPLAQTPWLEILLHFRWIGRQITDPSLVFQASLSNARLLMKVAQPTVSSLMNSGLPIIAIATLLYAPGSIQEAMSPATNNEERLWKVEADQLRQALRPYPKLLAAISPKPRLNGVKPQDVTLYELLRGNAPLDPRRLFLWQPTNNMANPEDVTSEMPYFSDPTLIERYAYTESFSFTFYLRQGRPSFAYATLIASLAREGATLSKKMLFEVYVKAYVTAIRNFANQSITAACAAFIEMLGRDSLSIRIDLQTARVIADHMKGQRSRTGVKGQQGISREKVMKERREAVDKEVVHLMMSCMKGSELSAKCILQKLEEAIMSRIDQQHIERVSWKAAEEWNLAVMFCRLHSITMTTVFLLQCATEDNWLLFTCFAQVHQYSKLQLLDLVKSFRSSTIREHISHALSHLQYGPAPVQEGGGASGARAKLPIKDYRAAFYTKMGFLQDVTSAVREESTDDEENKSATGLEASQNETRSADDDTLEDLEKSNIPHELFEIIFACGSHSCPWKAFLAHSIILQQPVLAVIASCHQGANTVDCICSWLYSSLSDIPSLEETFGPIDEVKYYSWSLEELRQLMDIAIATGRITLLVKAFSIFDNKGVLNYFLEFCQDFLVKRNRHKCKVDLEFFHEAILTCRRRSSMRNPNQQESGSNRSGLGHLDWFQQTANHVARKLLLSCTSQWELGFLLEVLTAVEFSHTVQTSEPDYRKLHRLHRALEGTGLELNLEKMLSSDSDNTKHFQDECRNLLDRLQQLQRFDRAKEFAAAAGLSIDDVIIEQLLSELQQLMKTEVGTTEVGRIAFWVRCNETLGEAKVDSQVAVQFFQTQASESEMTGKKEAKERAVLLGMAYHWMARHKSATSEGALHSLEQEMWLWRLRAQIDKSKRNKDYLSPVPCLETTASDWFPKSRGIRELLYNPDVMKTCDNVYQLKSEEEIGALDAMIASLLSNCCISEAHRLAGQFDRPHTDLSIVLTCLRLMQGRVRPEGIDPSLRSLVKTETVGRPIRLSRRPSNMALLGPPSGVYGGRRKGLGRSPSVANLEINTELSTSLGDENLASMEGLAAHTSAGRKCCDRIINIYRITQVLGKPFDSLVKQVPFTTVKALLQSTHPDRFLLAKDFIRANGLPDNEVANFLSDVVKTGLQQKVKKRRESSLTRSPAEGPSSERLEKIAFVSLSKLCKDPASLGTRLLEEATHIAHSDLGANRPELSLEVELIISAHECFTLSCNMEGITSVLRASRDCCTALAQSEEYSLMVRLVLGVRRFSEMTYCFEILRANHKMDVLLQKGAHDDKLKVALLDYLKRCDPPDTETYSIVALKFEMLREVAGLLEQGAKEKLKSLETRSMDTNIEIQNILESALHDLTNAAKNFSQDNCLRRAERCLKQARLVALQLHLLPLKTKVINLSKKDVAKLVSEHPRFHESLIVQDAYKQQSDWSAALYHNVITQGNFRYLEDFKTCMQLTPGHFNDIAARYRQLSNKSSLIIGHMQKFLGYCSDVLTAYRIANQLEFKDIAFNLLKGDAGAYLSDVA